MTAVIPAADIWILPLLKCLRFLLLRITDVISESTKCSSFWASIWYEVIIRILIMIYHGCRSDSTSGEVGRFQKPLGSCGLLLMLAWQNQRNVVGCADNGMGSGSCDMLHDIQIMWSDPASQEWTDFRTNISSPGETTYTYGLQTAMIISPLFLLPSYKHHGIISY